MDDVVPLSVVLPRIASENIPRIRKCKEDQDSNWASIIIPNKRGEEQQKDPELKVIYSWIQEKKGTEHRRVGKFIPHSKSIVDQSFFTYRIGRYTMVHMERGGGQEAVCGTGALEKVSIKTRP